MGCAVGQPDYAGEHDYKGLASSHAYTLLGALVVDGARLVRIRNPWGKIEWNGDWSDQSDLWTPELRKQHGVKNEDDGIFHMTIEDFQQEYATVSIAKVHDNYHFSSIRCDQKPHGNGVIFRLKKK